MTEQIELLVDGVQVKVVAGSTVAVVVALQKPGCRRSVTGQLRGPLCGMGICFECRVTIDGKAHRRSCQIIAQPGMVVTTDV